MTSPVSAIEAIEKAIEHATPGPWQTRQMGKRLNKQIDRLFVVGPSEVVHGLDGICEPDRMNDRMFGEDNSNMLYIAACNPVAMREVLALARQAEALQRENAELVAVRESGRVAAAVLHDALMIERGNVAALRQSLSDILETAEQYWANPSEVSEIVRARALLGGSENAE